MEFGEVRCGDPVVKLSANGFATVDGFDGEA